MFDAFQGHPGSGQTITTGAGSASISIDPNAKSIRVVNYGTTNPGHVRIGIGAQVATAADTMIRPSSEIIMHKGMGEDTLAYIQSSGATTLHIQTGEGGS